MYVHCILGLMLLPWKMLFTSKQITSSPFLFLNTQARISSLLFPPVQPLSRMDSFLGVHLAIAVSWHCQTETSSPLYFLNFQYTNGSL